MLSFSQKPPRRHRLRNHSRSGSLYPIVMGVTALIACMAVAGLEMSRVAGRANQQLCDQIEARRLAQAGLEYWQRQYNAQALSDPASPLQQKLGPNAGFTVSATLSPLGIAPKGAAQVTSVGMFGTATQRLTARYEARPTLYEGLRCALYSNNASISHSWSSVYANHWSIAKQNTSSTASSIFMDAMTGNTFGGARMNFRQRRVSAIPWNNTDIFDHNNTAYPGAAYTDAAGAITIQPPRGGDQLLSNPDFSINTFPWVSNSEATFFRDTTQGHNSESSGRMTLRQSGLDSPVQEISSLLIKDASYSLQAFVRPDSAATFGLRMTFYFSNPVSQFSVDAPARKLNAGQWTNLNWNFIYGGPSRQPDRVELGFMSDTQVSFNFDNTTLYNLSRNAGISYIQNTVLSDTFNPYSINNSSPAKSGIYIVDCQNSIARVENCRIRSTLVFTNCTGVELHGGIVWDTVNRNYPAIIANAPIADHTRLDTGGNPSLNEWDTRLNANPTHTPFGGTSDTDYSDTYWSYIDGAIFTTSTISLGNSDWSRGKIPYLSGPIMAGGSVSIQNTTKSIWVDSNMILNPPPGFYPAFTPMRLIPSSIDEASMSTETLEQVPDTKDPNSTAQNPVDLTTTDAATTSTTDAASDTKTLDIVW